MYLCMYVCMYVCLLSGPTQIISHSHSLFALDEDIQSKKNLSVHVCIHTFITLLMYVRTETTAQPASDSKGTLTSLSLQAPLLVPGDLLVMDSRLLHRGLGNRSDIVVPIILSLIIFKNNKKNLLGTKNMFLIFF